MTVFKLSFMLMHIRYLSDVTACHIAIGNVFPKTNEVLQNIPLPFKVKKHIVIYCTL
jgi:hypothetical protein